MTEARFLIDSSGEATQNPRFDGCVLDLAGSAELGIDAERIERAKLTTRAMHCAGVRIEKGLLLEASPEARRAAEDAALEGLPTEEFEIIAKESDDPERMARIRDERQKEKPPMTRQEVADARLRRESAMGAVRRRLAGRPRSGGRRSGGRTSR